MSEFSASQPFNLLPGHGDKQVVATLPLPGVVIFVHGVNSDGEWYDAAEEGLCEGLNTRLARHAPQLAVQGDDTGRLIRCAYMPELSAMGFIDPDRSDKTFIAPQHHWSPVIRFRWGYKASKEDIKTYGGSVFLNEHDYWGGGPFANGCSALADLWTDGLNDRLFLWITAQHLNPVPGRDVYACPHRAYYAFAALRLAKLIKSIRDKQPDCPITAVCHSQGNMVGIGAAFLADRLGVQADNFILCNPPLSLVDKNGTEGWVQRYTANERGESGRVSQGGRITTLANFFNLLRARAGCEQPADQVDRCMANPCPADGSPGFTATSDRRQHGLGGTHTHGRVTLYCNPHDQVISAVSVQGIGWRGMDDKEIAATNGEGVFSQRVFAHGYKVGQGGQTYDFWAQRALRSPDPYPGSFWIPPSPPARYSLQQGLASSQSVVSKILTVLSAPLFIVATEVIKIPVNAKPDDGWKIPINAPVLPKPFLPTATRYVSETEGEGSFDEVWDPVGRARNAKAAPAPDDPYTRHGIHTTRDGTTDAPQGNEQTEAQLRYEHRAQLRMRARRQDLADASGAVSGESPDAAPDADYQRWRDGEIRTMLKECVDASATDHSSILTNSRHAELALAYDVAIGVCRLTEQDWRELRVEADWRYCATGLDPKHPHYELSEYFLEGKVDEAPLYTWISSGEGRRPEGVVDERVFKPTRLPETP